MFFKKNKIKIGKGNLDDDLDFNLDNLDLEYDPGKENKNRSPVTRLLVGSVKGAKDKLFDKSFIKKQILKNLPEEFGETSDFISDLSNSTVDQFRESIGKIKPQAAGLTRQLDRLVPDEMKRLKKITGGLNKLTGEDENESYGGTDPERLREESITNGIAQIFSAHQSDNLKVEAHKLAREKVKDHIEGERFVNQQALLSSINSNVTGINSYNLKVNAAFQKKSLELQFRSYFVQAETLKIISEDNKVFKEQLTGILKNTGLPDYSKLTETERWANISKNNLMDKFNKKVFSKDGYIEGVKQKIVNKIRDISDSASEGFNMGGLALDQLSDIFSQDMGADIYEMVGKFGGGAAAEKVLDKIFKAGANKYAGKGSKIRNGALKLAMKMTNPAAFANELKKSEFIQNGEFDPNFFKGKASILAKHALDIFSPDGKSTRVKDSFTPGELNKPSIFDNATKNSIINVIPGYLSRILRESMYASMYFRESASKRGLVLGDKPDTLMFSHRDNSFKSKKDYTADILGDVDKYGNSRETARNIDEFLQLATTGVNSAKTKKDIKSKARPTLNNAIKFLKSLQKILKDLAAPTDEEKSTLHTVGILIDEGKGLLETARDETAEVDSRTLSTYLRKVNDISNTYSSLESIKAERETLDKNSREINPLLEKDKLPPTIDLHNDHIKIARSMLGEYINNSDDIMDIPALLSNKNVLKALYEDHGYQKAEVDSFMRTFKGKTKKADLDTLLPMLQGLGRVRESSTDIRGPLLEMANNDSEVQEILLKNGIIRREKDGSLTVSKTQTPSSLKRTFVILEKEKRDRESAAAGMAASDYRVKKDIKPYSSSLEKLGNLPSYKWQYKHGVGDGGKHIGPMAQDVYNVFGDKAAPGGKKIDLVTLNGINMEAIGELGKNQSRLMSVLDKQLSDIKGILGRTFDFTLKTSGLDKDQIKAYATGKYDQAKGLYSVGVTKAKSLLEKTKKGGKKSKDKVFGKSAEIINAFKKELGSDFKELDFKKKLKRVNQARRKLTPEYFKELQVSASDIATALDDYLKRDYPKVAEALGRISDYAGKASGFISDNAKKLADKVANNKYVKASREKFTNLADKFKDTEYGGYLAEQAKKITEGASEEIRREGLLNLLGVLVGKGADGAGDAAKEGRTKVQQAFHAGKKFIDSRCEVDVYILDEKTGLGGDPILTAIGFRNGFYKDKKTGLPIKNACAIKGSVLDNSGHVLLTKEQLLQGIYDGKGNRIKVGYGTLGLLKRSIFGGGRGIKGIFRNLKKGNRTLHASWHKDKGIGELRALLPNWVDKTLTGAIDVNYKLGRKFKGKRKTPLHHNPGDADFVDPAPEPAPTNAPENKPGFFKKMANAFKAHFAYNDKDHSGHRDGSVADQESKAKDKEKHKHLSVLGNATQKKTGLFGMLKIGLGIIGAGIMGLTRGIFAIPKMLADLTVGLTKPLLWLGKLSHWGFTGVIKAIEWASTVSGLSGLLGKSKLGRFALRAGRGIKGLVAAAPEFLSKGAGLAKGLIKGGVYGALAYGGATVANHFMSEHDKDVNPSGNPENDGLLEASAKKVTNAVVNHPFVSAAAIQLLPRLAPLLLDNPVGLAVLALGVTAFAIYKGYEYFKNKPYMREITNYRMAQHGVNPLLDKNKDKLNMIANLEYYFMTKCMGLKESRLVALPEKADPRIIYKILKLGDATKDQQTKVMQWLLLRFIPVLNYSVNAYIIVNPKLRLIDIDQDTKENKSKYFNLAQYPNGPYGLLVSPFKDDPALDANKMVVDNIYQSSVTYMQNDLHDTKKVSNTPDHKDKLKGMDKSLDKSINKTKPSPNVPDKDKGLNKYKDTRGGIDASGKNPGQISVNSAHPYNSKGDVKNKLPSIHSFKDNEDYSNVTPVKLTGNKANVKSQVEEVAKKYGFDPSLIETMIAIESKFNPDAIPRDRKGRILSSATGLMQFLDKTWGQMAERYGSKFGITPGTPRQNVEASTIMGGLFAAENMKVLHKRIPNPTAVDIYAAHFLGAEGAGALFNYMQSSPNAPADRGFPDQAAQNVSVFYNRDKTPKSYVEVYQELARRVYSAARAYNTGLNPGDTFTVTGSGASMKIAKTGKSSVTPDSAKKDTIDKAMTALTPSASSPISKSTTKPIDNSSNVKSAVGNNPNNKPTATEQSTPKTTPVDNNQGVANFDTSGIEDKLKDQSKISNKAVDIHQQQLDIARKHLEATNTLNQHMRNLANSSNNKPNSLSDPTPLPAPGPALGMQRTF